MELEIAKTENGFHVKDVEENKDFCFESVREIALWLRQFMPVSIGDEIKITD